MDETDVLIVGAGIAGASLGWRLARRPAAPRVLLIEREPQPGVHSTGRSAAMFMATYGPPQVRALTRASRAFYAHPPTGFTDLPLLQPLGVLYVAAPGQQAMLDDTWATLQAVTDAQAAPLQRLDAAATLAWVPVLRADQVLGAIAEPDAMDLDVHALHQGFLRGARAAGAQLLCDAELQHAHWDGTGWLVQLADGRALRARHLVNAAGAWADEAARRCGVAALGLQPRRRSAFTFKPPEGVDVRGWPAVVGIDESYYFKPDAGRLLGSPANADDTHPHDVQPEELDIALGIHAIEQATTLAIRRPESTWAGLRTFAPDGELVIGADGAQPAFFWLAGQGGYGIQSAAGTSALAEALLCGEALPADLRAEGVDAAAVSPQRFR